MHFAKRNNPNFREGCPKAKITDDKLHAYELLKSGLSYKEVSKRTRLSVSTIQRGRRKLES
ncbi:uncharacterized protein YerC [Enterococcus rivorum]|nr:uncharacterized protein YerC [Enterococcus rivorum]